MVFLPHYLKFTRAATEHKSATLTTPDGMNLLESQSGPHISVWQRFPSYIEFKGLYDAIRRFPSNRDAEGYSMNFGTSNGGDWVIGPNPQVNILTNNQIFQRLIAGEVILERNPDQITFYVWSQGAGKILRMEKVMSRVTTAKIVQKVHELIGSYLHILEKKEMYSLVKQHRQLRNRTLSRYGVVLDTYIQTDLHSEILDYLV